MNRCGFLILLLLAGGAPACGPAPPSTDPIFIDGRAVAAAGDTLLAFTRAELRGIVLLDRRTGVLDTIALESIENAHHIQYMDGRWYVSDVENGRPALLQIASDGTLESRVSLDTLDAAPHQFAVLPDGRVVFEAASGELRALADSTVTTFAIVERSSRSGLLVGTRGGVLHAVHGHSITFYNAQGNIRWRLRWPWKDEAFVSDIAVDARERIYLLAGEEGRDGFVVFNLSPTNGEVVDWSEFAPNATFVVTRLGRVEPDSAGAWLEG
ncbi:MAG: hypothetical protein ACE5PT_00940 [Gemmatimonadales bacterium]